MTYKIWPIAILFSLACTLPVPGRADTEAGFCSGDCPQKQILRHISEAKRCLEIEPLIKKYAPDQVLCYSTFFAHESGCNAEFFYDQAKLGLANAATGICPIEVDPKVRKENHRLPECVNISKVEGQVACCIHMMKQSKGLIFKSVREGILPRCSP